MNSVIHSENLEKIYKIYKSNKEKYLDFFLPKSFGTKFYALENINFDIDKGDSLGLIGLNGSGKSTLANIIAGYSAPTNGSLKTHGSISMISVSAGVDIRLTGIENIVQKGLLLGLNHKEIKELMPEIIEFSELGDFISQTVKTYSSGMRSKLGFAISVNINPDILIIDEALSVGDQTFTQKCLEKMNEFRKKGKTIVFVSHSMDQVKDFCNKGIWLHCGKIKYMGEISDTVKEYKDYVKYFNSHSENEKKAMYEEMQSQRMRSSK